MKRLLKVLFEVSVILSVNQAKLLLDQHLLDIINIHCGFCVGLL